jgi:hypothetical protein
MSDLTTQVREIAAALWPGRAARIMSPNSVCMMNPGPDLLSVKSLDSLRRCLERCDAGQRERFDQQAEFEVWERDSGGSVTGREYVPQSPSRILTSRLPLLWSALHAAVCGGGK